MSIAVAPQLDFSEIPVLDLASLIAGLDDAKLIEQLTDACTRVGFFYVRNHGVNPQTVSELHNQAKLFFALPDIEKEKLLVDYQMRGYLPLNYRSYEDEDRASTSKQEGFWVGHETLYSNLRPLDGPNRWPQDMSALRQVILQYFDEVERLSELLVYGFARSLGVEPDSMMAMFKHPTSRLKLNHYPPQDNPVDEHNIGVLPHTDSGAFTVLWQDQHGGLEIENKKGEWVGAPPIANTFVVNLGNIMPIWSDGQFASTRHRVINRGGNDRYSIPLFVNPNQQQAITPVREGSSNAGDCFKYGEYQSKQWRKAFPVAHTS